MQDQSAHHRKAMTTPSEKNQCPSYCCLIYRQGSERDKEVALYLAAGLDGQDQILMIVSGPTQEAFRAGLKTQGFATTEAESSNRLVFATPEGLGLVTAAFAADAVACLAAAGRKATAQGFRGVRIYWEMSGAMLEKDLAWLQECLVECGRLTISPGVTLLCGYDRRQVTSGLLVEVLRLYPQIIYRGQKTHNCYYLLPDAKEKFAAGGIFGASAENFGIRSEKRNKRAYGRRQVLDAIFTAAPIGLWMLNKEQQMVFTNHNFCLATGVSEEQFLQAVHYSTVMPAEEAIECMLSDAQAFEADGPVESEELITSVDGNQRVYRVVKTKVVNSEQEVEGLLGLAIDITEHKEAERNLRHSEARFRDIALSMADFIWEVDASGRFIYCSDKVEEMLGFSAEKLCGRRCFELFSGREAQRIERLFCDPTTSRQTFKNLQTWVLDNQGQRRYLRVSGVPIVAGDGSY